MSIDQARDVREGEELDADALGAWLAETLPGSEAEEWLQPGEVEVQQFPSGHSNLTYLLKVGEQEVVLRRPPFGAEKIKKGHDMEREFRILSGLIKGFDKVPRPYLYCENREVIGAPFYLMERLKGTILRGNKPKGLELTESDMAAASRSLVDTLVEIHDVDLEATGLDAIGRPEGYVERQVKGWTERYMRAKTDEIPAMEEVAEWLEQNRPPLSEATLVHNDFKYDNIVFAPEDFSSVIGVLDWELSTVGDPLIDLGSTLAYWLQTDDPPALQAIPVGPTAMDGNLNRRQVVDRYAEMTGRNVDNIVWYYVFALFRVGGIGQQIYFRFKQGDTNDPRFEMLIYGIKALASFARETIDRGTISH